MNKKKDIIKIDENYEVDINNPDEVRKYIQRSSEALKKAGSMYTVFTEFVDNGLIDMNKHTEVQQKMSEYIDYIYNWSELEQNKKVVDT